jgi:hypothetical protein
MFLTPWLFEVLTVVTTKITGFWVVSVCSLVNRCQTAWCHISENGRLHEYNLQFLYGYCHIRIFWKLNQRHMARSREGVVVEQ